jgi:hypothetical protein
VTTTKMSSDGLIYNEKEVNFMEKEEEEEGYVKTAAFNYGTRDSLLYCTLLSYCILYRLHLSSTSNTDLNSNT